MNNKFSLVPNTIKARINSGFFVPNNAALLKQELPLRAMYI